MSPRRAGCVLATAAVVLVASCASAPRHVRTTGAASAPVLTIVSGLQEDLLRLGYAPGGITGRFSAPTVAALERFQSDAGVPERGALGPQTAAALDRKLPSASEAVRALESALTDIGVFNGVIDGRFDDNLVRAVEAVQQRMGVPADGQYGPQTDAVLEQLYARVVHVPQTTTTAPPAPSSTIGATTSTTNNLLELGSTGPKVLALQQRLAALGYRPGTVDGVLGAGTVSAVLAFQKREGLPRDGIAGPQVLARLQAPTGAGPRIGLPVPRIEVDIARQVLFLVLPNAVWTLNASTGSGLPYQDPTTHATDIAATPVGTFAVQRTVNGDVQAPLGTLHKPMYFFQGWAVHGAASVPGWPASHGCVRVSDDDADWLFPIVGVGTPVVIYDTAGHSPTAAQLTGGAAPGY
ncbi:MAG TPA: peptidoglycan-binding protein [Acidimicrobiales bacterium]|nr:peptidoglycan-binding protein [Acidimicrobiales bacterium]